VHSRSEHHRNGRQLGFRLNTVAAWLILAVAPMIAHANGAPRPRASPPAPVSQLPPPGTILSESSRSMGHGYREVNRSVVNPPGGFEGIGHFGFVFYGDHKLCQCDYSDVAISPDGKVAIFVEESGRLVLFRAATRSQKQLSKDYAGIPKAAAWDISGQRVTLTLEKRVGARNEIVTRVFAF
jgi:hypothetical protein